MGAVYSVLGFLMSVPVGEMLAEYIVIIGVISLIKDDVIKTDVKHLTTGNGFLSKRNENAPNNLERNRLSVDRADPCEDPERKTHLEYEFDTDLAEQKFSDKNSKALKTDFVKERKQNRELRQERREGETFEIIIANIRPDHHISDLTTSPADSSATEEHLKTRGQTIDEHKNTIQRKVYTEISGPSRVHDQHSEDMAQDGVKEKTFAWSDDHVDRLCNVYGSSGEEESFYDCENLSPKAERNNNSNITSAPEGSENLAKKYENNERRLSSFEPSDRPGERKRKPEETDPLQVSLLCQDNDNFRLWNELLTKENGEFSCEIKHLRTDFDRLRQENEQLKKDKKELLELMELLQLKKKTGVVEHAKSTDDLTDGSENFVREQPVGASSAEELSSPPVKEEEDRDKRNMAAPVASPVDVKTTVQLKDQMRIQEREKRYSRLLFQFVFVGDSGVGKTSFIKRFCDGKFSPKFNTTVGVDFLMKTLTIDGNQIFLQVWDTAGQERFRSIARQYFRKADGVVIMYDVTSENSFKSVRNWMNSVQEGSGDGIVVAVVGNKRDLVDDADSGRVVTSADGANLAKEFNAFFYECSAKTGQGLDKTMVDMASLLLRRRNLDDYQKQSSVVTLNKSRFSARRTNCCMTSRTRNRYYVI